MNGETVEIFAALLPQPALDLQGRSPRELMERLLRRGVRLIVLDGALIDQDSPGVALFVEDDARILLEMYAYAESALSAAAPFEFDTFLGDGLLAFTTISDGARVTVRFRYAPGLDIANLVTWETSLDQERYAWWWRSIAAGLLAAADTG